MENASGRTNPTEVKSFLGLVSYCSRYIPDFSTIAELLRALTKSKAEWKWDIPQNRAFSELKTQLASFKVLVYFNPVGWGCEKYHLYLYGRPFDPITDHKTLEFIYSMKSKPSSRLERWVLRLQPY